MRVPGVVFQQKKSAIKRPTVRTAAMKVVSARNIKTIRLVQLELAQVMPNVLYGRRVRNADAQAVFVTMLAGKPVRYSLFFLFVLKCLYCWYSKTFCFLNVGYQ